VTLRVETIPDLVVHERRLELDRRSQPTRCFGPEKPTRCNTMELSSFEQIKLTPAAGARRGALDALPILLTLCQQRRWKRGDDPGLQRKRTRRMGLSAEPWWTGLDPQILLKIGCSGREKWSQPASRYA